jgi:hypothetical protein
MPSMRKRTSAWPAGAGAADREPSALLAVLLALLIAAALIFGTAALIA